MTKFYLNWKIEDNFYRAERGTRPVVFSGMLKYETEEPIKLIKIIVCPVNGADELVGEAGFLSFAGCFDGVGYIRDIRKERDWLFLYDEDTAKWNIDIIAAFTGGDTQVFNVNDAGFEPPHQQK